MRKATRRYFISFRLTAQERKQVGAFRRPGETVHQTARRLVLRASLPVAVGTTGGTDTPLTTGSIIRSTVPLALSTLHDS